MAATFWGQGGTIEATRWAQVSGVGKASFGMDRASSPIGETREVTENMLDAFSRSAPGPAGSLKYVMKRPFIFTAAQSGLFEERSGTARKPGQCGGGGGVFCFLGYGPEGRGHGSIAVTWSPVCPRTSAG